MCYNEEEIRETWKTQMEEVMNEEKEWAEKVEADVAQGPEYKVTEGEVMKAIKTIKLRKAADVSVVVLQ